MALLHVPCVNSSNCYHIFKMCVPIFRAASQNAEDGPVSREASYAGGGGEGERGEGGTGILLATTSCYAKLEL